MSRIIVARHGETDWNAAGRIQGASDIDLNEAGRQQADLAAPGLAAYEPDLIVASPLRRAFDTASPVAELVGISIATDERLREREYGPWEGLTNAEIREKYPEDAARWRKGQPLQNPQIESWEQLSQRASEAMRDIAEKVQDGTAIVVCHGGSARQAVSVMLGWDVAVSGALGGLDNCHWAELRQMKSGKWRLFGYNLGPSAPHEIGSSPLARAQQA
ncbi:histidine phosphatase family protein [Natronoglycomyces albus]|uniref:Histidine phosphatase family protein n=1 Tax=Natronoglycomyces albus TaxID=2811108 RepID=A0A895XLQ8_9ACTN|nr:histidine phosphatase family protein [Natronoglycomyces albus]QSB04483.1 histidine phosphatase family protein [Natronoglycomyces albus]